MTEAQRAVIDRAMEFSNWQSALDHGAPAQAEKRNAETALLDACAELFSENDGEWRAAE